MGILRKKTNMLQKIRAFLFGDAAGGKGLSYVEQQIDTGKFILEMMDKANLLDIDVSIWIQVGEAKEGLVFHANSSGIDSFYKIVSRSVEFWVEQYAKEQGDQAAKRIWEHIEQKLDTDQRIRRPIRGLFNYGKKVRKKK
jgi:hypothetical protein